MNKSILTPKERISFFILEKVASVYELITRKEEYKISFKFCNDEYEYSKTVLQK